MQIQKSYMKSNSNWNDNSQLSQALSSANTEISNLLKVVHLTEPDKELAMLFNTIYQDINSIKNKGNSQVGVSRYMVLCIPSPTPVGGGGAWLGLGLGSCLGSRLLCLPPYWRPTWLYLELSSP